jgi:hypothetical protein
MEANELRINNYVYSNINNNIEPLKCLEIRESSVIYDIDNDYCSGLDMSFIEPIPITEEWKTKLFSWFSIDYRIEWKNNRLHLYLNENYVATCDYVHEYQNLHFALTRRELTVA